MNDGLRFGTAEMFFRRHGNISCFCRRVHCFRSPPFFNFQNQHEEETVRILGILIFVGFRSQGGLQNIHCTRCFFFLRLFGSPPFRLLFYSFNAQPRPHKEF